MSFRHTLYWQHTPPFADMKVYVEGIRCPQARPGMLADSQSVQPRPVIPRGASHY
jgi:hypothetical protein